MIEVEVKLKIDSADTIENKLLAQGFVFEDAFFQEDNYFDTDDGKIRKGGQALRLRATKELNSSAKDHKDSLEKDYFESSKKDNLVPAEKYNICENKETACITFKGVKLDSVSMTRQELETSVGDKSVMEGILGALGYHAVPPSVKKIRKELILPDCAMHACLDEVVGLGAFLELEVMAEEEERPAAMEKIERTLQVLGYELSDTGTNSYLSMLQGIED